MNKILLSYTTINDLYESPHSYLNKALGIQKPTNEYMEKGKECHKKIQDHVSGKRGLYLPLGSNQLWQFPTIEKHFQRSWDEKYNLHGYADGVNYASKTLLEIKSSQTTPKTQNDFEKLMQGKYYCYVSGFRKVYYISCTFDLTKMKTFLMEYENDDMVVVEKWVRDAIDLIEKGNLKSDLVDGKCELERCPYGENCHFK